MKNSLRIVLFITTLLLFHAYSCVCDSEVEYEFAELYDAAADEVSALQLNEAEAALHHQLMPDAYHHNYEESDHALVEEESAPRFTPSSSSSSSSVVGSGQPSSASLFAPRAFKPVQINKNTTFKLAPRPRIYNKPITPEKIKLPAAQRLTQEKHREKFQQFLAENPKLKGKVSFATFMKNRERIVKLNDLVGAKMFRSITPLSGMSHAQFKRQVLTAVNPVRAGKYTKQDSIPIYNLNLSFGKPKKFSKKDMLYDESSFAKSRSSSSSGDSQDVAKSSKAKSSKAKSTKAKSTSAQAAEDKQTKSKSKTKSKSQSKTKSKSQSKSKSKSKSKRSSSDSSFVESELSVDVDVDVEQTPSGMSTGGSGRTAGSAGGGAQLAGAKGGSAGGGAQLAGAKGGSAGGDAQLAGSKGGSAGGDAQLAGSKGGSGGGNAGISGSKGGGGDLIVGPVAELGIGEGDVNLKTGIYRENGGSVADSKNAAATRNYLLSLGADKVLIDLALDQLKKKFEMPSWLNGGTVFSNVPQIDGKCGSCWAHVTVFALSVYRVLNSSSDQRFSMPVVERRYSPQQILNCVKTQNSNGCTGGSPMDALEYLSKNPIGLLGEFPLTHTPGPCKKVTDFKYPSGVIATRGWAQAATVCPSSGNCPKQALAEFEMLYQFQGGFLHQIIVYVDATNWSAYNGGIFPVALCSSSVARGNHVVLINGYGYDRNTDQYFWRIQNTWGSRWGEGGMIRLPWGVNACGVGNFPVIAKTGENFKVGRPSEQNAEP